MSETTFEEAKRCPICSNPGKELDSRRGPRGSTLHRIECASPRCRWYGTAYVVQINRDGTIPPATLNREKSFRPLPERTDAQVENIIRRAIS